MRRTRAARLASLALPLGLGASRAAAQDPVPPAPARVEAADVPSGETRTWTGEVVLATRVRVAERATLRIEPGTLVVVPYAEGVASDDRPLPGIEVSGTLAAEGTATAPIRFVPEPLPQGVRAKGPRWFGVAIASTPGASARIVRCLFDGAMTGVQPARSEAAVRDCVFVRCGVGVGTGSLWDGPSRLIRMIGDVAPAIDGCRFLHCAVGVAVEMDARPVVLRCVFDRCLHGVGNFRPGITYPIRGLGPHVDRCEFLRCRVGVHGPSRVTNSVFEANELVFSGSEFGERHVTQIDRYVRSKNLYVRNLVLAKSDVPLGADGLYAEPERRGGAPPSFESDDLLGPLDAVLGLSSRSPGVGAATDGGDIGAFGASGAQRGGAVEDVEAGGLLVAQWLHLGPAVPVFDGVSNLAASTAAKPRAAGDVDAGSQWALLDGADLSDVDRSRRSLAALPGVRVLLASFSAPDDARAALRLAWDGSLDAWWNGAALRLPETPRRYWPSEPPIAVDLRKGLNTLVVRHTPRGMSGRLSARLGDVASGVVLDGVVAAPLVRAEKAPGRAPVASAAWTTEKASDGKPTGRVVLKLTLAAPVHWRDAVDLRRYALTDAKGRAGDLAGASVAFRPVERVVLIALAGPRPAGDWHLSLDGWRDAAGEPIAGERLVVPVR